MRQWFVEQECSGHRYGCPSCPLKTGLVQERIADGRVQSSTARTGCMAGMTSSRTRPQGQFQQPVSYCQAVCCQVNRCKPDPVALDRGGLVEILPHRGMQQHTGRGERQGVCLSFLRPQVGVNLVYMFTVKRGLSVSTSPQDTGEFSIDDGAVSTICYGGPWALKYDVSFH